MQDIAYMALLVVVFALLALKGASTGIAALSSSDGHLPG